MPKQNVYLQSFNVGVVDPARLVRVDLERMRLAAEDQTNFLATTTGNMFLRPGLSYIANSRNSLPALLKGFEFDATDGAELEFTSNRMRVIVDDAVLSRVAVSTQVTHPQFEDDADWQLSTTPGATADISGGKLRLTAYALGSKAVAKQQVTIATADIGKEHALRIVVDVGPITFRCGRHASSDDYISEAQLFEGVHSLAFTPTGDTFWVRFQTTSETPKRVSSCMVESAGVVEIQTPWAYSDLGNLRFAQSADVMFVACDGQQQMRIERRSRHSWSVVKYWSDKGPFMADRSAPIRLRPEFTRGVTTLHASDDFFTPDHVGALFKLNHNGQLVQQSLADDQVKTDPIKVTGVYNQTDTIGDRDWTYTIAGTWGTTLQVERSVDTDTYGFKPYRQSGNDDNVPITGNVSDVVALDTDDNAIIWYRIGFADAYASGVADITIRYDGGGGYGICRVMQYVDAQTVQVHVIVPFKGTDYTSIWLEGQWSQKRGFPTSVALSEGRLFWSGNDKFWGSVSDAYDDFDEETIGDSGPINRSIAIGSVNEVKWMLALQRLVVGTNAIEVTAKSTNFDEPLSPTNLSLKSSTSIGSAPVEPVRIDSGGVFVDRTGKGLCELLYSADSNDYAASELSRLCVSKFKSGVVQMAVSRQPDTRVWVVLKDGTCICMVYEPQEKVVAFVPITTDGAFESVCVVPGPEQGLVYFVVKRTISGIDYRFVEKMGIDTDAGTSVGMVMDAAVSGSFDSPTATVSGLSHLVGEQVKVWADGAPVTTLDAKGNKVPRLFTVDNAGQITLPAPVSSYVAGLRYQGRFKSSKLAYAAAGGTAMLQKKRVNEIGLIAVDYVRSGVRYGKDDDHLFPLPANRDYSTPADVSSDLVIEEGSMTFDDEWHTDSRIVITAEWPVNFLGLVFAVDTNG
jgi:hypothetical protein